MSRSERVSNVKPTKRFEAIARTRENENIDCTA